MRILIATDHYPPFIGGAHRQSQLLAWELRDRGHTVAVATMWQPGRLERERDDRGMEVHRLHQLRTLPPWGRRRPGQRFHPPFPDPVAIWRLRRIVARYRPDVVHAYGWISYSVAAALIGRDIPLLLTGRDYAYSCATRDMLYMDEETCGGPGPLRCLACSAKHYGAGRGTVAALGVNLGRGLLRRKMRGLHSISSYVQLINRRDFLGLAQGVSGCAAGLAVDAIIPSFRESAEVKTVVGDDLEPYLAQLPAEPFILFVGALRRVKGVYELLEAYGRLESPPPLVLIGTMEKDSPRQFPPGVRVLRDFPHPAVMAAWERSLFGVIPSRWPEPLGSVVYEGMSRGKAVIGTTPGGHTDMIVDGETGFLVPAGDVNALTAAMRQLIDDPSVRERFGHAGRERSRQFTAIVALPEFESVYASLVGVAPRITGGEPGAQ